MMPKLTITHPSGEVSVRRSLKPYRFGVVSASSAEDAAATLDRQAEHAEHQAQQYDTGAQLIVRSGGYVEARTVEGDHYLPTRRPPVTEADGRAYRDWRAVVESELEDEELRAYLLEQANEYAAELAAKLRRKVKRLQRDARKLRALPAGLTYTVWSWYIRRDLAERAIRSYGRPNRTVVEVDPR